MSSRSPFSFFLTERCDSHESRSSRACRASHDPIVLITIAQVTVPGRSGEHQPYNSSARPKLAASTSIVPLVPATPGAMPACCSCGRPAVLSSGVLLLTASVVYDLLVRESGVPLLSISTSCSPSALVIVAIHTMKRTPSIRRSCTPRCGVVLTPGLPSIPQHRFTAPVRHRTDLLHPCSLFGSIG